MKLTVHCDDKTFSDNAEVIVVVSDMKPKPIKVFINGLLYNFPMKEILSASFCVPVIPGKNTIQVDVTCGGEHEQRTVYTLGRKRIVKGYTVDSKMILNSTKPTDGVWDKGNTLINIKFFTDFGGKVDIEEVYVQIQIGDQYIAIGLNEKEMAVNGFNYTVQNPIQIDGEIFIPLYFLQYMNKFTYDVDKQGNVEITYLQEEGEA